MASTVPLPPASERRAVVRRAFPAGGPQGFRWRLDGDLPPLHAALRVGEAVRNAVYTGADSAGLMPLPDWFHAADDAGHSHAHWLPEDEDGDGRIDHLLLFCERGLPEGLAPVLAEGGEVWLGRLGEFRLLPDWMGRRAPGALFGPALGWASLTPFVTTRWRTRRGRERRGETAEEQILREAESRGLPAVVRLDTSGAVAAGARSIAATRFLIETRDRRPPEDAAVLAVRIVFARPVWGPLALGFGSHFGLGLFAPLPVGGDAEPEP
jgi:CRISPR-associated protein Csb2